MFSLSEHIRRQRSRKKERESERFVLYYGLFLFRRLMYALGDVAAIAGAKNVFLSPARILFLTHHQSLD